ncbi:MAG TPA: DNA polymerase domain-containing protein, partial [Ktedonobacteraceae bacterium]
PGIVSVWANREGKAIIWRREDGQIKRSIERFSPWVFATQLDDLEHLKTDLQPANRPINSPIKYQQLDGVTGSYRYLLLSHDGRTLEHSICYGASRRLGRQIKTLNDLQDDYYRVGPVEQYLMQTGRVYFRGLRYEELHRLQFDLETTALDPHRGRIFLVSLRDNRGLETVLEASSSEDEKELIRQLCAIIRERDPDVIENHNLFGFDLPFLEHRAQVQDVPLHLARAGGPTQLERRKETLAIGPEARSRTRYSVAGRELIDTLDAVRKHDFVVRDMPGHGLKEVARYFGIASNERVYIEGSMIYETYQKRPDLVRHYALDDVREVDGLSRRLLGAPFALASMAPRRYERLASAGPAMGILEPILVRSYLHTGTALPHQGTRQNATVELHEGGAVHLFAAGIAEHVVKADVASLYPSLMRTFQIGPQSDRLNVLLHILGRLTDLRLAHKAEAKSAEAGSVEANHHEATQAAMKILINAAYGYMGAGDMALFADSRAASEVTRRGRAILGQVLEALRQQGMALIEADTDGVYFSVPSSWSEEQERSLVQKIGAQLPSGINLEYEGRYRAMFSHEVKNYALLTYNDRLIVHGVAMRSSRVEPFGERFLRKALYLAMLGDVKGLHDFYLTTAKAIRERILPASDLATRVRLSKTPEEYFSQRSRHQEQAYEALITAGRRKWYPGERVRFYRARNKRYIWIPEESDESSVDNDWQNETHSPTKKQGPRTQPSKKELAERRDYDVEHYLQVLISSYAARLRKAFASEDFEQLFRLEGQEGLFDQPVEDIQPLWIRCSQPS